MSYAGIDYSRGSGANTDLKTGIRYGVIAINSLASHIWDDIENIYTQSCPKCGSETIKEQLGALVCDSGHAFSEDDSYPEEPSGKEWAGDPEYQLVFTELYCFVTKAPVVIKAKFCSPCMPGAGDLDSPNPDGTLTYALDSSFFDEYSPMPYDESDLIKLA